MGDSAQLALEPANQEDVDEIREVLVDRAARHLEGCELGVEAQFSATEPMHALGVAYVPMLECLDDFGRYLLNRDLRQEVIDRFVEIVRPILQYGTSVEVIR